MSGSISSPLGQINLRSSLCGVAHMELNATCWEGANRTDTVLWLLLYRHYCCQLHKGNPNQHRWQKAPFLCMPVINSSWCPTLKLINMSWNWYSGLNCVHLKPQRYLTYLFESSLIGDGLTSTLEPGPLESIRKDVFVASFFSPPTCPLCSFAYEHSPKYPHKRLMSFCSCILPFIGWETMHQRVCASILDSYFARKRCYATGKCILIVQSLGAAYK